MLTIDPNFQRNIQVPFDARVTKIPLNSRRSSCGHARPDVAERQPPLTLVQNISLKEAKKTWPWFLDFGETGKVFPEIFEAGKCQTPVIQLNYRGWVGSTSSLGTNEMFVFFLVCVFFTDSIFKNFMGFITISDIHHLVGIFFFWRFFCSKQRRGPQIKAVKVRLVFSGWKKIDRIWGHHGGIPVDVFWRQPCPRCSRNFPESCRKWNIPGDSKWPFHPLVGGHLTIEKGHLTIPKRSQRIARYVSLQ